MSDDPQSLVEIWHAPTRKACLERALVLQARGLPHRVIGDARGFHLLVPSTRAREAATELAQYGDENAHWPPAHTAPPVLPGGRSAAAAWVGVLLLFHPAATHGFAGHDIWNAGKLVASRVRAGEWWRTVTALTLHGGMDHLIANLISGAAFLLLAAQTLGGGLALLATVLAGAFGNLLNAWLQAPSHTSIGASTAVFGTLGLLASYEWVRRHALGFGPLRRWAPLMAGAALLGYLGMGGDPKSVQAQRTDVIAHITGFLSGAFLGFLAGRLRLPDRLHRRAQLVCSALTFLILCCAWIGAWSLGV